MNSYYFEPCALPLVRNVVACKMCEFLFSDAEYSIEDMDEYYSHYYTGISYAECPTTWNYLFERETPIADHVISCINNDVNISDLIVGDIGCGKGDLLSAFHDKGVKKLIGIEASAIDSEYMRSKPFDVIQSDICTFTTDEKLDIITCTHVLEHILDPIRALKNIYANLNEDGYVYIEVPNAGIINHQSFTICATAFEHINFFTPYQLATILKSIGFSIIDCKSIRSNDIHFDFLGIIAGKKNIKESITIENEFDAKLFVDVVKSIPYSIDLQLKEFTDNQKPVYIWGISAVVSSLWEHSRLKDCNVAGLIDKSPDKQGLVMNSLKIEAPEVLAGLSEDSAVVIGAIFREESVVQELRAMGYKGKIVKNICSVIH